MIRAVLFDYGGVMTFGGGGTGLSARLSQAMGISGEQAVELILSDWREYLTGKVNEAGFWVLAERRFGVTVPSQKRNVWNTWEEMMPAPEMVELVRNLRANGYRVGLVSNTVPPTSNAIAEHGGYDGFEFLILSHKAGYAKPDVPIYEKAMEQLRGIGPKEVIFIDDQERCLAPARAMGMQTILAESPSQIITELDRLSVATDRG